MTALALGTLLALVALGYVLYPILFGESAAPERAAAPAEREEPSAIDALREIEFDRATGKLSEADYVALKGAYTRQALAAMRAEESAAAVRAGGVGERDPAEAAVLKYRSRPRECALHGARPEADALYCSECGRFLAGACERCRTAVTEPAARYCTGCGRALAA